QTILVGDSGVGKTSLLVQFDQGKFIPGSFSATVGIGFTVRAQSHVLGLSSLAHPCESSFIW
ncbi:RAB26 protein, partial [Chionis minor]|nr:RAB26 protein [Chionis minor]NXT54915.1 RAB26 protein [Pluvianellus socialis]